MKLDMPLGIGLNAPYQNAGKVRNTGWEVSVGYNNQWRDFSFGVQANLSDVKNEILDMRGKTSTSGVLRNQEGYSIGSIYALKSLGIIRSSRKPSRSATSAMPTSTATTRSTRTTKTSSAARSPATPTA